VRRLLLVTALLVAVSGVMPAAQAEDVPPWEQVLDITFPTRPDARVSDTFDACRDGCARAHQAADLMGEKMWPLYAAVSGEICRINDGVEDSYGRNITVCGDDGNRYRYLHLNNDTPGTDDGAAGLEHVYAPGIRKGVKVARGQLIAYMGDSGNAEETAPHLHLDIFVPGVVNPWGEERINPYPSLMAALDRGDIPDGTARFTTPMG
jgi:murein DD-endopeptidase MepM/ murein hydrolase activator NlpD